MEASMLRGQISRSRGEARSPIDVHRLREILVLRSLDHDLLANVAKRVGDRARRNVATEHVAHVFPSGPVSCHVRKVPERRTTRQTIDNIGFRNERNIVVWNAPYLSLFR